MEILGTYPILNSQSSSIDENGIQTIAYTLTVPTSEVAQYIPNKDDEYYGPSQPIQISNSGFVGDLINASKFLVTSVDMALLPGGLTQITVKTAGSQNVESAPRVRIIPNYPLIFGLSSISQVSGNRQGSGSSRLGYGVIMTFITKNDPIEEGLIFQNLSNKIMPAEFRGTKLPIPTRQPFTYTTPSGPLDINFVIEYIIYKGFIGKNITVERIGGVTLFQLLYSESGRYSVRACATPQDCSETVVYDYIN